MKKIFAKLLSKHPQAIFSPSNASFYPLDMDYPELKNALLKHFHGACFAPSHVKALNFLRLNQNYTTDEAVKHLDFLSIEQAEGIAAGLDKNEVTGLRQQQVKALIALKPLGLTASVLRQWDGIYFGSGHIAGLESLLIRGLSPQQAVQEITHLSIEQAAQIATGSTRREVLQLADNEPEPYPVFRII